MSLAEVVVDADDDESSPSPPPTFATIGSQSPQSQGVRRARQLVAAAPLVSEIDPLRSAPQIRPGPPPPVLYKYKPPAEPPAYARGRELAALLYVAISVFIVLGLASYDERGGADWVGPVGAHVSALLVSAVGLVAWSIPLELALFAVPYLRGRPSVLTPARAAGDIVLGATGAALLHVGAAGRTVFGGHLAGGVVGELCGELLRALFSTVGTFLVGFTAIALVLIARATFSFIELANRAGATGAAAANKAAASVKGVAEAWNQAREIERAGGTEPRLVSGGAGGRTLDGEASAELGPDVRGVSEDRPSAPDSNASASLADGTSGALARSQIRLQDDGLVPPEAHTIARELAGMARRRSTAPPPPMGVAGVLTPEPNATDSADPTRGIAIIEHASETGREGSRGRRRRAERGELEPTIAPPPTEAAVQRVATAPATSAEPDAADDAEGDASDASALIEASRTPPAGSTDPAVSLLDLTGVSDDAPCEDAARAKKAAPTPPEIVRRLPPKRRGFKIPGNDLLDPPPPEHVPVDRALLLEEAKALVATLATYKVIGEVREIHPGPVVTTYELEPRIGTKVREVEGLANDLRLSLAKESVRIVAPIPGKNRIGFELPNAQRLPVNFRELVEDRRFLEAKGALPVILGRDIVGAPFYADLAAMPHLLVAGATGAGKSVGLNVMLTSLLYRRTPDDLRMIMIDPKVVELAPFDRIPHMLLPVVTDMKQALNALKWCVDEMERRYQLLAQAGVKNITTYNVWRDRVVAGEVKNPIPRMLTAVDHNGFAEHVPSRDPNAGEEVFPEKLPYLVVVVDEFADLMMSVGKGEVEPPIARLAQKARAAGIHVVLATQRPSVDVITGMIKANFPTRIAFRVAQRVDSRTILDAQGAEYLLGKGDMLVSLNGGNGLKRIQCPFVSEEEVQRVCDYLRAQGEPVFDESILASRDEDGDDDDAEEVLSPKDQELFDRCVDLVREARKCSTSWLQRKMGLGYNKAARFVDRMERQGVVGPPMGAGKDREVI